MRNLREKYRSAIRAHRETITRSAGEHGGFYLELCRWPVDGRWVGHLSSTRMSERNLWYSRFTTCLIFKWYGKLKIQCTKWHENVGTWNLDLVCRCLSFFCGSDEILVLMLVMVCHFYVIFWTWSMLKYDRDRFPFLKPEHVMCVPFMNIHEYHINQQMANDSTNFYGFSFHHPKCMR